MDVLPREELAEFAALGELSLDGSLNPVSGVLPAAIGASGLGIGLICAVSQGGEAAWAGQVAVLAAPDLLSLVNHFRGIQVLTAPEPAGVADGPSPADLADVRGIESAKRALEIAAAGNHNLLLIGPPGSGKSMLAVRLSGLLPDLLPREALEMSMIHSVAGMLTDGRLVMRPPYREPHHSASQAALTGGGQRAKPGEVSLAHHGVLFLDELPEFPRQALEALRQPMEAGRTTVARAAAHVTYPARFQLVAAMNPCRCGHLGDAARECGRAPRCGEDYQNKISGPLLDRIDLTMEVQPVSAAELSRAAGRSVRGGGGTHRARPRGPARPLGQGRPADQRGSRREPHGHRTRGPHARRAGCREAAPVAARLHPHPARGPQHRRPGRQRHRAPPGRGRGAGLPSPDARPAGLTRGALGQPAPPDFGLAVEGRLEDGCGQDGADVQRRSACISKAVPEPGRHHHRLTCRQRPALVLDPDLSLAVKHREHFLDGVQVGRRPTAGFAELLEHA
jgi:MoxR-like ATPase